MRKGLLPHVLHPAINDKRLATAQSAYEAQLKAGAQQPLASFGYSLFVSINRYERKKQIGLCIAALHALRTAMGDKEFERKRIRLVIAGHTPYSLTPIVVCSQAMCEV